MRETEDTIRPWEVMTLPTMVDLSGSMNIREIIKVCYLHQTVVIH